MSTKQQEVLEELKQQVKDTQEAMFTNHIKTAVQMMFTKFYNDYQEEWKVYPANKKIEILDKQLQEIRKTLVNEITEEDNGNDI